jgi:hypothetical protein
VVRKNELIRDLQESEIARFFVVLPDPAESPFGFLIERLIDSSDRIPLPCGGLKLCWIPRVLVSNLSL